MTQEQEPKVLTLCMYCFAIVVDADPKPDGSISYGYCEPCWERDKPLIEKYNKIHKDTKLKNDLIL